VFEIHKHAIRPEFLGQFVASDELARSLKKRREDLERLLLETDFTLICPQLPRPRIEFEFTEADTAAGFGWYFHRGYLTRNKESTQFSTRRISLKETAKQLTALDLLRVIDM
jgi:hypothetical protein